MTLSLTVVILGLVVTAAEIAGGSVAVLKQEWINRLQEYLLALGAGFILALVLIDLVPESIQGIGIGASLWVLVGFSAMHFVEHTVVGHLHFGEETHSDVMISRVASYSAFSGLFIHAFFDGLSIAAGMQYNVSLGVMIFVAILLHKFPEGLTVASIMLAAERPRKNAFWASVGIGAGTMVGIFTTFFLTDVSAHIVGFAFAFSAGAGLYVGASDLIPEVNRSGNRITPIVVFVGMLLFYLSSLAVGTALGR
ncbi:MAG: ZIP family metal transporter [Bacteroidota bacterium]|nr:ZIP family metal transporter [Bacteroidota bacterium]